MQGAHDPLVSISMQRELVVFPDSRVERAFAEDMYVDVQPNGANGVKGNCEGTLHKGVCVSVCEEAHVRYGNPASMLSELTAGLEWKR